MKKTLLFAVLTACTSLQAATVLFDLSPAGSDNAIGLSPLNEVPPIANSTGSGNETGSGITFDTGTLTLSLSFGYGSAAGFSNLTGAATAVSLQGPAATNATASVVLDLTGANIPAADPANGGSVSGSVVLSTNESADLLAGLDYINIDTAANSSGEVRGQLIPVDTLPALICPASTNAECQGAAGTPVTLSAVVSDDDGDALTVVWIANGVPMQTNSISSGSSTNATSIEFSGLYQFGTNTVEVSVSDGIAPPVTCSLTVAIIDTIPPVITSASITPDVLWPPNHKFIPVEVSITATDSCGSVTTSITSITSNESPNAKGSGHTSPDARITGDLTGSVRAERSGKDKGGRVYTVTVEAVDEAGNTTDTNLFVLVPHDQGNNGSNTNDPPSTPPGKGKGKGKGNGNGNGNGNGDGNGNGNGNGKGHDKS